MLAAVLGYVNHRFLKLPSSIRLTVMGAIASLLVVALDRLLPGADFANEIVRFIAGIDFHTTLMDGMLSLLLFAGALHIEWHELRRGRWPIIVLSTIGVAFYTAIVGGGFLLLSRAIGFELPAIWCFVFGALISPTDPVSVMGVLKRANAKPALEATVAGESLFNDGVGVVIFTILLASALSEDAFCRDSLPHGPDGARSLLSAIGGSMIDDRCCGIDLLGNHRRRGLHLGPVRPAPA